MIATAAIGIAVAVGWSVADFAMFARKFNASMRDDPRGQ